jgi:hypothetical protein
VVLVLLPVLGRYCLGGCPRQSVAEGVALTPESNSFPLSCREWIPCQRWSKGEPVRGRRNSAVVTMAQFSAVTGTARKAGGSCHPSLCVLGTLVSGAAFPAWTSWCHRRWTNLPQERTLCNGGALCMPVGTEPLVPGGTYRDGVVSEAWNCLSAQQPVSPVDNGSSRVETGHLRDGMSKWVPGALGRKAGCE